MIRRSVFDSGRPIPAFEAEHISTVDRQKRVGHASVLICLNGGDQLAFAIESELFQSGYLTHAIAAQADGTVMLEMAKNLTAAGLVTICAADFLYEIEPDRAQALMVPENFIDVDASLFSSSEETVAKIGKILYSSAANRAAAPVKLDGKY